MYKQIDRSRQIDSNFSRLSLFQWIALSSSPIPLLFWKLPRPPCVGLVVIMNTACPSNTSCEQCVFDNLQPPTIVGEPPMLTNQLGFGDCSILEYC